MFFWFSVFNAAIFPAPLTLQFIPLKTVYAAIYSVKKR